ILYKHGKCVKVVHDLKYTPGSIKRWIVRYRFRRFRCSTCLATFYSPEKSWTGSKHGRNLLAYVVYQLVDLQLSHQTIALKFRLMGGERAVRPRSEPPDGERCGYEQTMPFHHSAA